MQLKNYPIIYQDDPSGCGVSCIAMILNYYNYHVELSDISYHCRKTKNGISIKGMMNCLNHYSIETKALECSLEMLSELKQPCILFCKNEVNTHFVVLYKIEKDHYILGDPAEGIRKLTYEQMQSFYLNKVISIVHVGRVDEKDYQSFKNFLFEVYYEYKGLIYKLVLKSIIISLCTYLGSYLYSLLIDFITVETHLFICFIIPFTYTLIKGTESLLRYFQIKEKSKLQIVLNEDLVEDSLNNVLNKTFDYFDNTSGIIQSKLLSLFELSSSIVDIYSTFLYSLIITVVLFTGLMFISFKISLIIFILMICISFLSYFYLKRIKDDHKHTLEHYYKYASHVLSSIENQLFIKTFGLNKKINKKNHSFIDAYHQSYINEITDQNHLHLFLQLIIYLFYFFIMFTGILFYKHLSLTMGQFIMYLSIVSLLIEPIMNIISTLTQYSTNINLFNTYKEFKNNYVEKKEFNEKITSITFDDFGYSYGYTKKVFEHIDGSYDHHVLVSGDNGTGKSTLLKLILGYDLNYNGDLYVNTTSLKDINLDSLYRHIGYLNENASFIHSSLKDNFMCEDESKIIELLSLFQCDELVPLLDLQIDESGLPLSLGQRQLVAFIRLILKEVDVYLLDECFTHLDSKHYKLVMDYLKKDSHIIFLVNHQFKSKTSFDLLDLNQEY